MSDDSLSADRFTLLVVDDEKQNRTLLTELLHGQYTIVLAKNGVQAIERARANRPDLILLDVLMPEMDGYAVIRALKADDELRRIPVIFISALDSVEDEEKGLELGAVDYIAKPFHPPIVRVRVKNHLASVHQRRLLEQLAMIDSLTEIPNRRRFNAVYDQEWRRCQRTHAQLSILVLDVDYFKRYNDTLGHIAGDAVLRQVAGVLRNTLRRPGDFVARFGGEEFVLVLPDVDAEGARVLAEQIRRNIAALCIPHPDSAVGPFLTVSIGGASRVPDDASTPEKLLMQADAYLYSAKQEGRNRVHMAPANGSQHGPL